MPQPLKTLRPGHSVRDWFGAELRHWRLERGLTQADLGRQVWTSGSLIGKIETAERECPEDLARKLDEVLGTGGVLGRAQELLKHRQPPKLAPALRREAAPSGTGLDGPCGRGTGTRHPAHAPLSQPFQVPSSVAPRLRWQSTLLHATRIASSSRRRKTGWTRSTGTGW
ncbi:helix-turn-helix transcriptional regulator [Thermobifida halotolerans]|uniref:Helix-turn-helix transcriptional regulator n=1 Tax=Thermobifida halotolerans TaxID=483545 RepID=A0AA97LZP4_9ACTN|nr:helix-turn-helix transcriptional regulator [Thermobifida halotolerans]UOE21282.1 helix-turn-helix transcriptional regulator [Thermobifida halotolerans]